ncbi:hypothetical protein [Chryseolinea soli]|uniref:Uncharacterized protein n=1 Tax=Chryseolinea soli TaxID=2321403 RepID=A0A385SRJ5_9BACT|nr:hypothetical protein [Chryseolinea soli]AYB34413.1 hypothetical protein D4L85_29235 [Chryseolinea soli]
MKRTLTYFAVTFLSAMIISACKKDDDGTYNCPLSLSTKAPADGLVVYSVTLESGAGVANLITYQGTSGKVTLNNPDLPFHVTIDVKADDIISIATNVTAMHGKIAVGYAFSDPGGVNPEVNTQYCEN